MKQARIKIPASECEATCHCISRTVNGAWLIDDVAKEILRRHVWQVVDSLLPSPPESTSSWAK